MTQIKVVFFKPETGKYYTENYFNVPKNMEMYDLPDLLKETFANFCTDMDMVAMCDELEHGYPVMVPVELRNRFCRDEEVPDLAAIYHSRHNS